MRDSSVYFSPFVVSLLQATQVQKEDCWGTEGVSYQCRTAPEDARGTRLSQQCGGDETTGGGLGDADCLVA